MKRLTQLFYNRHVVEVAKDLLGKTLVFGEMKGIITETEAYRGEDDEASHAFKKTPRSQIMFEAPGFSYVYFIYGMYHCLNVVTERVGQPGAVLIRGLKISNLHLNGPGKICKHLGITKDQNGINLEISPNLYFIDTDKSVSFAATPRIGIKKATDKLWRFISL